MSGNTIVASDSMTKLGVEISSFPHVIFSFGIAPLYEPYEVVESEIWQKYAHFRMSIPRSCSMSGTTQIGKSPEIPPPIWKKPIGVEGACSLYQAMRLPICSRPLFTTP